jgi:hypothetical protein
MERKWEELTADEKRDQLWQRWLSPPGVKFSSPEAEKAYKERTTRIKDAVEMKKVPDRVPVVPIVGFFPAYNAGVTPRDLMYDYDKMVTAFKKYILDFEPDGHAGAMGAPPGKMYEILDYRLYKWPGHGVPPEHSYQAVEGEYMKPEEYDILIQDPSFFFNNYYLPRIFKKLEPFSQLSPLTNMTEMYGGFTAASLVPYGLPDVQEAMKALMEAGSEALKWIGFAAGFDAEATTLGYPDFFGGGCKVPFDTLGDTLRGTRGMAVDMYRRPEKLLKALEVLTPIMITMGASAAKRNGNPIVFIPLHKGADGFLSDQQFKTFYWPQFKKLILGLIDEGCVPFPWAEGGYNTRLEVIRDVPKGKVIWGFDTTDMAKAKEVLGDVACITGNVPTSILGVGTPDQVTANIRKLIKDAGKGGGYIMMNGATLDDIPARNVRAMIEATKEYGVYK